MTLEPSGLYTQLWTLICSTGPWVLSLCCGDVKFLIGPKYNIYTFYIILIDLILLFVCQI